MLRGFVSGLTHADFGGCFILTDAAVLELAVKYRELTHADFRYCDVTDAAKATIEEQRPHCEFEF